MRLYGMRVMATIPAANAVRRSCIKDAKRRHRIRICIYVRAISSREFSRYDPRRGTRARRNDGRIICFDDSSIVQL